MRMSHVGCAAVLLTFAALALPVRAIEVPSVRTTWLAVPTRHFFLISDAGRGKVHDTARDLERLATGIGRIVPLLAWSPLPTEAVMFSSNARFEEYCAAAAGKSCKGLAGIFLSGRHANYLLISGGRFDDARAVACHELTHSILHNSSSELPVWLDEGLAEIYGSASPVGDDILVGRPEEGHLAVIHELGLMPVARVLAVAYDSPEYNQGNLRGTFYAESWLMTHYILAGPSRSKFRLPEYLERIRRGEDREQAFRAAFGMSTADFTKELHGYAQEHRMYALRLAGADLAVPAIPEVRPLPRDEALSYLAEPLVDGARGDPAAAGLLLAEARRANPASPLAGALLASITLRTGSEDQAIGLFEDAVRSPSGSAGASLLYAEYLLERAQRGVQSPEQDASRARELLKTALAAEPDNLPALTALGLSCVIAPPADPSTGIQALERALQLSPARADAAVNLAQLLARSGRLEPAVAVIKRYVMTSRDAALRGRAPELLTYIHLQAAELEIRKGRLAEAAAALEAALAAGGDATLQAAVRSRLKTVRDSIDLSAAVDLANKGDITGAQAALDRLIPGIEEPGLRIQATTLRARLADSRQAAAVAAKEAQEEETATREALAWREKVLRREAAAQREGEQYNEAVALANRGKVKEALAIAEHLARNATNETVKNAAVGLANRMRARLAGTR